MISLGRKGFEHRFSSNNNNKTEMEEETELEEGEACSYHEDDDDTTIDPDVSLSYIDEKIQNVLGHFKKDFEGVVSAESLGAKYGIYGSFLPAHRRSPVGSQSRSPPRVQNHITPQSPNTLQTEGGHHNSLAPANAPYSIKHGSASAGSASSFAHKLPPQNDLCRQNGKTKLIQTSEECIPKSEVRDQKTLKVRIKVGSDNLSVKKNAAIYSGLGLDGSPTSSLGDSPMESEGLSCRLSFDGFESPTRILQMMTSSLLFGGCFLSPLPDHLLCLSEKPKHLQDLINEPSFKEKPKTSVTAHPTIPVKDKKAFSGENNMRLLDKKGLSSQGKRDGKDDNTDFDSQLKETEVDVISCEELVSSALKLPLLSNVPDNMRGSPAASLKETVFSDASEREPFERVSLHVSLGEKSTGKTTYAGNSLNNKAAEVRNDMVIDSEKVGDGKSETVDSTANVGIGSSKFRKAPKIGLIDPVNQGTNRSTSRDEVMVVSREKEQFSPGGEKKPKKSQVHGSATGKIAVEVNEDSAPVLKDMKFSDAEKNVCRIEVRKDSGKGMGQYADFFGEMNELDGDVMDSPDVPSGEILKISEVVDKTSLAYENTSKERTNSLDTRKGRTSGEKLKGYSNIDPVPENGRPSISEQVPISNDANVDWVGCDKCQKWRVFPPGFKPDNLPDYWDCSMMNWLPDMNRCSASEEETNNFHVPPPGMTSADILSSGRITGKVRRTPKSSFQNSPKKPPNSIKKKQQSAKENSLKVGTNSCLVNGLDLQQQTKSGDIYPDTGQQKKIEKHRRDCYSDGGHAKIPKTKSKRESDHEFPGTSKKSKSRSMQSGDNDWVASHDQGGETLGVSSGYGLGAGTAGKDQVSNSRICVSRNLKDDIGNIPPDYVGKSKSQVEDLPVVGSGHVSKSSSGNRKRKADKFKDPPNSTPSSGKLRDDNDKSSRKRHRTSKSEGKESSVSKRNGKADKKSKSIPHHRLDTTESMQKDPLCVNPVVAATSSSSKISGSLKVKSKFHEVKGSPVESVSSSPLRIPHSDKLISGSKVIGGNDNVHDAPKLATSSPTRCSAVDHDSSADPSGAIRKDAIATGTLHGMSNLQDKSKGGLHLTNNGNSCIEKTNLDNGFPLEAQASYKGVNDTARGELHVDANVSSSGKSWKDSPSLSKDKNQTLKSNSGRGKVKMAESYDNSLNHKPVHEEKEQDRKVKVDEKCGSNTDKSMSSTVFHNKEPSFPKSEGRQEYDERRSSKKFDVEKSEDLVPTSAKEKPRHLPRSDGEKNEMTNKASTSASDARLDGLPSEPKLNKKADNQNGTHISSKHSISNGHRIKNQDAPSPLRRDSSSQAASSAIKEARNLKHLADRLKSSGSTESIAMYFEAALKFLHGASLLESGKTENIKHADIVQSKQIYSSTAKLCQFCAHEFERMKDMAAAALAYKCVEVAYMRVVYSSHNTASRDRNELQTALQMVPPGESPSSSASDIDNLNNNANGDKAAQARSSGSPQLAANLVITARNRPNFSRLLTFAQDVNSAMEACRKSHIAFAAANVSMGQADLKEGITSIKRALDFNFNDVSGLLRLVRLAKESISR
ncbi:hypothetical protein SOVF_006330 [Spinacia oleracea]|uniref:Cysteine-tryptophan domain-containing zinc finger protein 3 n=1 Tax=Spinacia oleracea TaxID=3562 RepID=A0A9R0IJA1_SPIOL|nr:cysteine-tryptophan domain-containing zinc finger protein 3 [Spinacia oleracea]XP_056687718.1 cysteine-tryptophan domain-containing zinc finger protein 3 [Spinacia oleracea]KNA25496.1 hypothetical protein SOVF_006330 [Spinacia oleracea]